VKETNHTTIEKYRAGELGKTPRSAAYRFSTEIHISLRLGKKNRYPINHTCINGEDNRFT
jgi:hypothetical protein